LEMEKYQLSRPADSSVFRIIFAMSPNRLKYWRAVCFRTSGAISKITNGYVNVSFLPLKITAWMPSTAPWRNYILKVGWYSCGCQRGGSVSYWISQFSRTFSDAVTQLAARNWLFHYASEETGCTKTNHGSYWYVVSVQAYSVSSTSYLRDVHQ
jgi:hypothetical protein